MSEAVRHLRSFIAPVTMSILLPAIIIAWEHAGETRALFPPPGGARLAAGVKFFVSTHFTLPSKVNCVETRY